MKSLGQLKAVRFQEFIVKKVIVFLTLEPIAKLTGFNKDSILIKKAFHKRTAFFYTVNLQFGLLFSSVNFQK